MEGKNDVSVEFEVTNQDLMTFLKRIQEEAMNQKKETLNSRRAMESKMSEIGEKIDRTNNSLKKDIKDLDKKQSETFDKLEGRMTRLEKELENVKLSKKLIEKEDTKEKEVSEKQVKYTRNSSSESDREKHVEEEMIVEDDFRMSREREREKMRKDEFSRIEEKANIEKKMRDAKIENEKREKLAKKKEEENKEKENEREKKRRRKKLGMRKLRSWFCDETEEEDTTEDESGGEWSEVQRVEKNKHKKRKLEDKRKRMQNENTAKAEKILGVGPINKQTLQFFMRHTNNIEKAKVEAVKEWLAFYMKFESEEIEEMIINATQIAANGDIVYVAFDDLNSIKDIHKRAAEVMNKEVNLRNYITPQYYDRYVSISEKCKEMRNENKEIKTQMRFCNGDIQVLVKRRGSEEPYKEYPLKEMKNFEEIPEYNYSMKWRKRKDRPARKTVSSSPTRGVPRSREYQDLRSFRDENQDPLALDKNNFRNPISRTTSLEAPTKKTKLNASSSSEAGSSMNTSDKEVEIEEFLG